MHMMDWSLLEEHAIIKVTARDLMHEKLAYQFVFKSLWRTLNVNHLFYEIYKADSFKS